MPLSDFNSIDDFVSLGFTLLGSNHLTDWVQSEHLQNPENMTKFLEELPTSQKELGKFNVRWRKAKVELTGYIPSQTKNNILPYWKRIKDWFWQGEKDKRNFLSVDDFEDIWLKNPYLCVSIPATSGQKHKAIAYIGALLRGLSNKFLKTMSPCLIFEEADLLFPSLRIDDSFLTSRNMINLFINKKLRYGLLIFCIVQKDENLDDNIKEAAWDTLVGKVSPLSRYFELGAKENILKTRQGVTRSEFIHIDVNYVFTQFYPAICSCNPMS
jgi:hypothetical protein